MKQRPARRGLAKKRSSRRGPPTSVKKMQRWVDLTAALLTKRSPATLEELKAEVPAYASARTKTSLRRTFERDKDELRALGIPIDAVQLEDTTGYRLPAKDFYLPYLSTVVDGRGRPAASVDADGYRTIGRLMFEPDEVTVLQAARRKLTELGQPELLADGERAMRKLNFDIPEMERRKASRAPLVPEATTFGLIMDALRQGRIVDFQYYGIEGDRHSDRAALPYGLFFLRGKWYLAAAEEGKPPLRVKNFRLDRISAPRARGTSLAKKEKQFRVPSGFSLAEHTRDRKSWELGDTDAIEVQVAFTVGDGAVTAAAKLGKRVPGRPGHRKFEVRRTERFVWWLLSFTGYAEPVSPPQVVKAWQEERAAIAALYAGEIHG